MGSHDPDREGKNDKFEHSLARKVNRAEETARISPPAQHRLHIQQSDSNRKSTILDCPSCKDQQTMEPAEVAGFGPFVRFIGFLVAIPTILGVSLSILMFFSSTIATTGSLKHVHEAAHHAGTALGGGLGLTVSIIIGVGVLIGGVVGYFLMNKKEVLQCKICGYILDRD